MLTYEDNRKQLYYFEKPVLFKILKDAQNFICERIFNELKERLDNNEKLTIFSNGEVVLDESVKYDLRIMNKFREIYLIGQFVGCKLDYYIHECEIR
jgi:hypothetical protein